MSTTKRNVWLMAGALVLIALVGFVDGRSSAYGSRRRSRASSPASWPT
jgi:hypothetical protein